MGWGKYMAKYFIETVLKQLKGQNDEVLNYYKKILNGESVQEEMFPLRNKKNTIYTFNSAFDNHSKIVFISNISEENKREEIKRRINQLLPADFEPYAKIPSYMKNEDIDIDIENEINNLMDPDTDLYLYSIESSNDFKTFRFRKKIEGKATYTVEESYDGYIWSRRVEENSYFVADIKVIFNFYENFSIRIWVDFPSPSSTNPEGNSIKVDLSNIVNIQTEIFDLFFIDVLECSNWKEFIFPTNLENAIKNLRASEKSEEGNLKSVVFKGDMHGRKYEMNSLKGQDSLDEDIYVSKMLDDMDLSVELVKFEWINEGRKINTYIFSNGRIVVKGRNHKREDINYVITRIRKLNETTISSDNKDSNN